jgi:hypothetical protein
MTVLRVPIDVADRTAEAYGRKPPRFRPIPETYGLAVMLLVLRNNERDRGLWLAHADVHDAVCDPAEQFAQVLAGRPSPEGWRAGALAGLRSLAGDALHEERMPSPFYNPPEREPALIRRIWVDDPKTWSRESPGQKVPSPFRARLIRDLAGQPRIAGAWDAMILEWDRQPTWDEKHHGRRHNAHRTMLCAWSSSNERPAETRWLQAELLGKDPDTWTWGESLTRATAAARSDLP